MQSLIQQLTAASAAPVCTTPPRHMLGAMAARQNNIDRGNARALALLSDTEWRTAAQIAKQSMSSAMTVKHMMQRLKQRGLAESRWDGKRFWWRKV